ncbi:hypothetical protein MMC18_007703 [Xylographa bjoerkii]|nr:hypothetical protein [Xylographa bjoerkii]
MASPYAGNRECFFLELPRPQQCRVQKKDVHELANLTKQNLLRGSIDSISLNRGQSAFTLERLTSVSPGVATIFSIKADTVDELVMRLYSHCNVDQNISSYIALSYCWRQNSSTYASSDVGDSTATKEFELSLPIHSSLFQALLNERESDSEGVWCDQICIDQSNESEKQVAIGLMDVIYKEARCVVVSLDDVTIDLDEEEFLRRYLETYDGIKLNDETRRIPRLREAPPNIHSLRVLIRLYEKIIGARWFTRAWCAHEMRMGKRHAFLVQCTDVEGRPVTVFRFDGSFLMHMICLAVEFPDHRDFTLVRVNLRKLMNVVDGIMKRGQTNNHLDSFTQIFMLDAGGNPKLPPDRRILDANWEKLAIVLNSVGSGLTIRYPSFDSYGTPPATHNECFRIISLLGLAANNPAVLCTSGSSFRSDNSASTNSWLRWPGMYDEDNMSTNGRTKIDISQILVDGGPNSETIQMDCLVLDQSQNFQKLSDCYVSRAQRFLSGCIDRHMGDPKSRFYNWRHLIELNTEARHEFTLIVACMIQCGVPWILDSVKLCGTSFAFHTAVQEILLRKSTVFKDIFDHSFPQTTEDNDQLDLILKFGYYIFEKCLHRPWDSQPILSVAPYIIPPSSGGPYLIFLPSDHAVTAMIPTALLADDYADLPRVWLLSQEVVDGVPRFELQGRSRIFGASLSYGTAARQIESVKVYGPSREAAGGS